MISTFWNIPGIQTKQSFAFLEELLDPFCVYDEQGLPIYGSQVFLKRFSNAATSNNFFDYFRSLSLHPTQLLACWQLALSGESACFLVQNHANDEVIQCSLHFNAVAHVMFLKIKTVDWSASIPELAETYERLLLTLLDRSHIGAALVSMTGAVMHHNQKFSDLLGCQDQEGVQFEDLVHPEDRWLDDDLKRKLLDGELPTYTIEKRLVSKQQETVWVNVNVSLIELPLREPMQKRCFAVLLEDTTENHKLYNALIRTEGKWKAFVLNSLNLFIQISPTGRIIYASPALERILGYEAEELLDRYAFELIHPYDLHDFELALYRWLAGVPFDQLGIECRWRSQAGRWIYLYLQGQTFPMALEIDGVALSGYDITDRKWAEAELRRSEAMNRMMACVLPNLITQLQRFKSFSQLLLTQHFGMVLPSD